MRKVTWFDHVTLWYWTFWLKVLPTSWLWEHGGKGKNMDGFTKPNPFGWVWLTVMSNAYYYGELIDGRIPEGR